MINDTKVIPARLIGAREGTGAKIEVLLLKRKENNVWETLVKPGQERQDQAHGSCSAKVCWLVKLSMS